MHPTDQISTDIVYSVFPNKISGALKQRVWIFWDKLLNGIVRYLAKPKSAIFTIPLSVSKRMLSGFKSQWITLFWWR